MPNLFSPELWLELASAVSRAYRMDEAAAGRLAANKTARLVAAIPYLAGCAEPRRRALAHLGTFVLADSDGARRDFDHKPEDDVDALRRLAPIADLAGGDQKIIDRGMRLLALVMISGYERDIEKDAAAGEYNPVGAKSWDAAAMKTKLAAEARSVASAGMDEIMTVEEALHGWWEM